jgi:quinol monooxygenase YgiN
MSVIITFQLPVSYEQFQEMNKKLNPENLLPPGVISYVVSQSETGLTITDIWEDEANAPAFYEAVAAAGFQLPPLVFSKVYKYLV